MNSKKKNQIINFFVSLITIVIALYSIQLYLQIKNLKTKNHYEMKKEENKNKVEIDPRNRIQFILEGRKKNYNLYPIRDPKTINKCAEKEKKILPLSSISKFKTVGSRESGKYTIFKNDKYGFKNKSNIYDKKKNKLLLIGDSMTHGPNVKIDEDIAGHLRKMKVNAFNYGGSGNGPLSNLATLKEYISVVKPKTVVWVHFENDLNDLTWELESSILKKYLDPSYKQNLHLKQKLIDDFQIECYEKYIKLYESSKNKKRFISNSHYTFKENLLSFIKLYHIRQVVGLTKFDLLIAKKNLDLYKNILKEGKEVTDANNSDFIFLFIPGKNFYLEKGKINKYEKKILTIAKDLNFTILDYSLTKGAKNKENFALNNIANHFSSIGNKVIANLIAKNLRK